MDFVKFVRSVACHIVHIARETHVYQVIVIVLVISLFFILCIDIIILLIIYTPSAI